MPSYSNIQSNAYWLECVLPVMNTKGWTLQTRRAQYDVAMEVRHGEVTGIRPQEQEQDSSWTAAVERRGQSLVTSHLYMEHNVHVMEYSC